MIRITSLQQALSHKGTIPELAIIRAIQFMGNGYSPEKHGHIIVIEAGDDITQITEIGVDSHDHILDSVELIESFVFLDRLVFEIVFQLDDARTVAVIIEEAPWLDPELRKVLLSASPPPEPLPQLREVTT
jgi:hypothetical protein